MAEITDKTSSGSDPQRRAADHQRASHHKKETSARPHLQAVFHQGRRLALRRDRVGTPPRPDHRRPGRRDLRAEGRRDAQGLVDDGDQHRGQQVSARPARHARARDRRPPARDPAWPRPSATGASRVDTSARPTTPPSSTTSSRTCCCSRRRPSTRRCGST